MAGHLTLEEREIIAHMHWEGKMCKRRLKSVAPIG
jgi:hypothetical protein